MVKYDKIAIIIFEFVNVEIKYEEKNVLRNNNKKCTANRVLYLINNLVNMPNKV